MSEAATDPVPPHMRCPMGCVDPQPFEGDDNGTWLCERCWRVFGRFVRMIPRSPQARD